MPTWNRRPSLLACCLIAALTALALAGAGSSPIAAQSSDGSLVYLPLLSISTARPYASPARPIPSATLPADPSPSAPPEPSATLQPEPSPTAAGEPEPPDPDDCPDEHFLDLSQFDGAGAQYPDPEMTVTCTEDELVVRSNGIPHYAFVPITPNPLQALDLEFRVPLHPQLAAEISDLPLLGTAGFAVNGLPFYGPNEAAVPPAQAFGDPIYNDIMDYCLGHTAAAYHYHAMLVECLSEGIEDDQPSPIIGYAADGFPIHGPMGCLDADCRQVVEMQSSWERIGDPTTNAWDAYEYRAQEAPNQLDRCNGRIGPDGSYRYHATSGFPYIIGCYRGQPTQQAGGGGGGGGGRPGPRPRPLGQRLIDLFGWSSW